ncbi:hypothetical protein D3C84_1115850 [compost metagenome]
MTDLAAELLDLGNHLGGITETIEHNVRAGLGQAERNTQADAAGGAGDQCGLACKSRHDYLTQCQWRRKCR